MNMMTMQYKEDAERQVRDLRLDIGIHLEPKIHTMDKKLVINVAVCGAFLTKEHNPSEAVTPKEIAENVIESYKAGASIWHVHTRDEQGRFETNPDLTRETLDRVLDQCPDMLLSHTGHADPTAQGVDRIKPLVDPLVEASQKYGREYIHSVVIAPYVRAYNIQMNRGLLQGIVNFLQSRNVKPEFQIHNYPCILHVDKWLIEENVLDKPYLMNLIAGYHGYEISAPTAPDPWGQLYFMSMMNLLPEGCVIGATIGGRNWLPMITEAIILGVDCVRIGMEDAVYMYPHKDEMISHCADTVTKVRRIAEELGREIATPKEARKVLGID
ncbi:3-keto-5-aminohexanoate cleavage protein [Chloroflexota bacterium]